MRSHIKNLAKIIEKQTEHSEQMLRRFYNNEREISFLNRRVERLEIERMRNE